jgi:hypothetical protein
LRLASAILAASLAASADLMLYALPKNEARRSEIERGYNGGESSAKPNRLFILSCGLFVTLITTALGIVLLNRILTIEYLNRSLNLNFITMLAVGLWVMIAFGFMFS